jgi:Protein of unknown function (DUF2868)
MPATPAALLFDEATARRLTLVRACESGPTPQALWSPQDAAWATRLAAETAQAAPGGAGHAQRFLTERVRHAMERLQPRDAHLAALLQGRPWLRWGLPAALALGLVLGLMAHSLDASQRINLLALPLWGVVLWNVLVYLLIASEALGRVGNKAGVQRPAPLRSLLTRWMGAAQGRGQGGASAGALDSAPNGAQGAANSDAKSGGQGGGRSGAKSDGQGGGVTDPNDSPAKRFRAAWAALALPTARARAGVLMHGAAAALGLGLIAGLYARGLLWDYRAGWQSTFLDAPAVHALLSHLLAPVQALTGLRIPDAAALAALRIQPGGPETAALGSAALWIHLLAASVLLFVVLPRTLLALWAAFQSAARARRVAVPVHEAYYQRLLLQGGGGAVRVQVVPHGVDLPAMAALGLNALVAAVLGEGARLSVAPTVRYGEEETGASKVLAKSDATLRLVCVDLATTPEAEAHGRLLSALQASGVQQVLLADESAWRQRFGSLPARLAERQAAWQTFAATHGAGFASVELARAQGAPEPARAALEAALSKQ